MDWVPTFERIAKAALEDGERVGFERAIALGAPAVGANKLLVDPRFTVAFVTWVLRGGWQRPAIPPPLLMERLAALLGECDETWDLPTGAAEPDWAPALDAYYRAAGAVHPDLPFVGLAWEELSRERRTGGRPHDTPSDPPSDGPDAPAPGA